MAEVIDEAVRREQALQVERIRLALRKAARASEIGAATGSPTGSVTALAAVLAWKRLGVADHSIAQVRKNLSNIALTVLGEAKRRALRPDLLAALETVKDALSSGPTSALPAAVRQLLLASLGPETAATVCDLYDAGLDVVSGEMIPAVRCLAAEEPSDVEVLHIQWGVEWRLFADVTLVNLGHAPVDADQLTAMLWEPKGLVDPARSGFHSWVAFLHAYELTLRHKLNTAWAQLKLFEIPTVALMTPIDKEVVNLRAYLLLLKSGDQRIGRALALLSTIRHSPTARQNRELLRARSNMTRNERDPIENPYLALGVSHGAPRETWRAAWMAIRSARRDDLHVMSDANEARDRIVELEKDESDGLGCVFVTPLDSRFIVDLPRYDEPSYINPSGPAEVIRLAALCEILKSIK